MRQFWAIKIVSLMKSLYISIGDGFLIHFECKWSTIIILECVEISSKSTLEVWFWKIFNLLKSCLPCGKCYIYAVSKLSHLWSAYIKQYNYFNVINSGVLPDFPCDKCNMAFELKKTHHCPQKVLSKSLKCYVWIKFENFTCDYYIFQKIPQLCIWNKKIAQQ